MTSASFSVLCTVLCFFIGLLVLFIYFVKNNIQLSTVTKTLTVKFVIGCLFSVFVTCVFFNFFFELDTTCSALLFERRDGQLSSIASADCYVFNSLLSVNTITLLFVIFCSIFYCVSFNVDELVSFVCYVSIIFFGGVMLSTCSTAICIFIAYECLLIPTAIVLLTYSKTSRSKEAAMFMIIWTQLGAILLLCVTGYLCLINDACNIFVTVHKLSRLQTNIIVFLIFVAFATKMPVWPFYWWLPEAHVEVSTNFSIVLSGVTVKFAFLGFMRFIDIFGLCDVGWFIVLVAMFGVIDSGLKIDSEADIKKIVAYQTVAEMHLLCMYLALDFETFVDFVLFLFPGHCWISTLSFLLVDFITKRYHSRNIEHLYGILANSPRLVKFIFLSVFILGSFPGTTIFSIELLVQIFSSASMFGVIVFIFFQCVIVVFSKNIWWLLFGGDLAQHVQSMGFTLTKQELLFILFVIMQLIPTLFLTEVWFL